MHVYDSVLPNIVLIKCELILFSNEIFTFLLHIFKWTIMLWYFLLVFAGYFSSQKALFSYPRHGM